MRISPIPIWGGGVGSLEDNHLLAYCKSYASFVAPRENALIAAPLMHENQSTNGLERKKEKTPSKCFAKQEGRIVKNLSRITNAALCRFISLSGSLD